MPSDKPQILIRTNQNLIDKLDILAKQQNRSRGNLAETILLNYVEQYENQNGTISIKTNNITMRDNNNINIG